MSTRAIDIEPFAQQAATNLVGYLQVDTINPPGNESRGVAYLGNLLTRLVCHTRASSLPRVAVIVGEARGTPDADGNTQPALVLLHHIDVVPANAAYWSVDPLSGEEVDGYIYGRGAIDTKGLGIVQLQAF